MEQSQPQITKNDSKCLDLAFAMDCTASMGRYINTARDNIWTIVEEIVASEKSDVRLALVEYRDHPPQDRTFVTRSHDFTGSVKKMTEWLVNCSAFGGGDCPEAVADALHDVLKLSWREDATKICVFITDAPPHGLGIGADAFPGGCPAGIDPVAVTHELAQKGVTIYMVGCEPSISRYKDFFMAMAFITGGQYVPLTKAQLLTQVIIGGAQEEISLERFMSEVDEEVQAELRAGRQIDEDELVERVYAKLRSMGIKTKQLCRNDMSLVGPQASSLAKKLVDMKSLAEVRNTYMENTSPSYYERLHLPLPLMASYYFMAPPSIHVPEPPPLPPLMRFSNGHSGIPHPPPTNMLPNDVPLPPMPPPPPVGSTSGFPQHQTPLTMAAAPPPPPPPKGVSLPRHDTYKTVEADISYVQSARMVQKSIARNLAKKKGT